MSCSNLSNPVTKFDTSNIGLKTLIFLTFFFLSLSFLFTVFFMVGKSSVCLHKFSRYSLLRNLAE